MGRAVDHRRQRVRPGSTPRQSGRRSGSGGRTLLRRRCRYAPGRARPDQVAALVLLDPAVALDGSRVREVVDAMLASPDYLDPAEARAEKATGAWADVDPPVLDAELDEHLVALPNGRYGWRISLPAMVCYWSELARDIVLPPVGTATTLVRAVRASPAYVSDQLLAALDKRLGADFELLDFDCGHMVPQAKPTEVAAVIRSRLGPR